MHNIYLRDVQYIMMNFNFWPVVPAINNSPPQNQNGVLFQFLTTSQRLFTLQYAETPLPWSCLTFRLPCLFIFFLTFPFTTPSVSPFVFMPLIVCCPPCQGRSGSRDEAKHAAEGTRLGKGSSQFTVFFLSQFSLLCL